jgi:hypothetical protein
MRDNELHLNRRETDVKGPHEAGGILYKTREATPGKEGRKLGRSGPRTADPAHFEAQLPPPLDLVANQTIYTPEDERHAGIHSSSATEEQRSLRDTISERRVV